MTEEQKIIIPSEEQEEIQEGEELKYDATEADEEKFFLMYQFNWPPSEVDTLDADRRKWIIARLLTQKQMEKEAYAQMQLRAQMASGQMPNFRVTD